MGNQHTIQPLQAPGSTVAERLAYWRSLSWAQMEEYMKPEDGVGPVPAATLDATFVSALVCHD